jgi:hypothetical protein
LDSISSNLPQLEHLYTYEAKAQELELIGWKCPLLKSFVAGKGVRFDRRHPLPSTLTYLSITMVEPDLLEEIGPLISRLAGLKKLDITAYPSLQIVWASFLALPPLSLDSLAIVAFYHSDKVLQPIIQSLKRQHPVWLPNLRELRLTSAGTPSVELSDLVRDLCGKRGIAFSGQWWQ